MAEAIPPFLWERDVLVEQYGARRYLYGRWDRRFGCWMTDCRAPARSFYPPWALVNASGRLCLGHSNEPARRDDDDDEWFDRYAIYTDPVELSTWCFGDYPADGATTSEMHDSAEHLFQRYVDLIPLAIRRTAGAFGMWQWVILSMIWDEPAFADFLRTELDVIGPGFVAACLVINGADRLRPVERADLCRRIMFGKRDGLIPGFPATCSPKTAVAAFGRFKPDALSIRTCRDLLGVLSDRSKAKIIARSRALTPGMVRLLNRLPGWICTGNLSRLLVELEDVPSIGQAFARLAERVERDANELREPVQRSLRQVRNSDHLVAAIESWNERISHLADFPAPPFPSAGPLRPLSSARMMRSEARRMGNCIASYVPEVLSGHVYFYCWDATERGCIMLQRHARSAWRLGDCLGIGNAALTAPTQARIRAAVRAALRPPPRRHISRRHEQLILPLESPPI